VKKIAMLISTSMLVVSLFSTPSYADYTIDQASRDKLVKLLEKSKETNEELDKSILETAVLFSIPPGLTVLAGLGAAAYFGLIALAHCRCRC